MVQKRKINTKKPVNRKSVSALSGKSKMGDTSLDWITDTSESEAILQEQAENIPSKSAGDSKETKIGVLKHYESDEAKEKKDETPEETPVLSDSNSTITKGKTVTSAGEKEAEEIEVNETSSVPASTAEFTGEEAKEKTSTAEEAPIEIGKTYNITPGNKIILDKVILDDEEDITVSAKKEVMPDDNKFPPKYEVKKEDVKPKEEIKSEKPAVVIPDDSSTIVKKKKDVVFGKEAKSEKPKAPVEKEETVTAAAREKTPSSGKRKLLRMSALSETLKKGGKKVSGTIVKPFKSDKALFKKTAGTVFNMSKQPVRAISSVDRKITQSMKKVVIFGESGTTGNKLLNNIQAIDEKITISAKKLIDSVLT